MFSYFTELNRKRPPLAELDFVSFTTSALVHAGDDRSVAEGLEALPHIARSVRAIVGDTPYAVGPSAIGMRDNPYGQATAPNPRQHPAGDEPQRSAPARPARRGLEPRLFRAFRAGRRARRSRSAAPSGRSGCCMRRPTIRSRGSTAHGGFFPVYHVVRGLARLARRADARGGDFLAARSAGLRRRDRSLDRQPDGRDAAR